MRWKYKVVTLAKDARVDSRELNALGSIGWELIAIHRDENRLFAYFRMPVEEDRSVPVL